MSPSRTCTIKVLDQVTCVFIGLHPDHVGFFYDQFGEFAPNYYFNPKYKLTDWDGKIHFFHRTGKTYVNLLPDIIPQVIRLGYKIKVINNCIPDIITPDLVDKDFFSNIVDEETDEPWEMRPYQTELVNALLENGGGVGIAGTGAGKTNCCASIALSYEKSQDFRSIIIVPDKNLTSQTKEEYAFFGIDVGEFSGERKDRDHTHIVSTWQSLKNVPSFIQEFQVVIVDECHGLRGNVLTKLLNEHGKDIVHRFGVTGTLPKAPSDAMAIRIAVGDVQYTIPAHALINQGYLAKLHIDVMQLRANFKRQYDEYVEGWKPVDLESKPATYTKFKDGYFPDWPSEKNFLQTEKERLEWIVEYIEARRNLGKGNVLCLVNGVRVGKKLAKMINDAKFVYGQDKMKARKEVYSLFKDNDNIVVIATVNIASTGLNIKRIFNLMFIDVGKSFIRTIQTIGRGLRKAPDKDYVLVTDICSDLKYSKRHLRQRINFYKEANYPHKKRIVDYSD